MKVTVRKADHPEEATERGSPAPVPGRCGARLRRSERYCLRRPLASATRCRLHGGLSPAGPANGRYVHGRYMKSLPARMVERAREALEDPELMSLRSEMALVSARISELLNRLDAIAGAAEGQGDADAKHWAEVRVWLGEYRKLQEAEVRRGLALQQSVSMEQMVGVIGVLVNIVADHVKDRDVLASIQRDVRARLLARPEQLAQGGTPLGPPQGPGHHREAAARVALMRAVS